MSFVIISRHPAFGKLFLGRGRPVASKKAALRFSSEESAQERIAFWKDLATKENLDPKFIDNLEVESA